jgi:hypothetical protein
MRGPSLVLSTLYAKAYKNEIYAKAYKWQEWIQFIDVGALAARTCHFVIVIGEEALELLMALWILIVVGRVCGLQGARIYACSKGKAASK